MLAFVLAARSAADAPATSDIAVIESYTRLATSGALQVGAYSRFQWHHPGPLPFYLLAPFYMLGAGRTAALNAGAAVLSLESIGLVLWSLWRRRPPLAALTGLSLALYAWRGAEALTSPWNPHMPVLPLTALLVASADVFAGATFMLPVVALLASVVAQAHVALVPTALAVALPTALASIARAFGRDGGRAARCSLALAFAVLLLAWALPLAEQVTAEPRGNMTELARFFLGRHGAGQSLPAAVSAWSDMLVGVLRPDFYVAHGWPFVESPVRWAEWMSLLLVSVITLGTARALLQRDRFMASLGTVLLLSCAVALWSSTRIEETIFDHDVFWIIAPGLLMLAVAVEWLARAGATLANWRSLSIAARPATVLCVVLFTVTVVIAWAQVRREVLRSYEPPVEAMTARLLADDILDYMRRAHVDRPLIRIDQDAWGVVAGAVLDLQKRGQMVAIEEDWVVMFTRAFAPTGHEDATITVAMPPLHLRLTAQQEPLISSHEPIYAHAVRVSAP